MIDWSRVEELKDEVGQEDFVEVAEMFLEEVDEVVARLQTSPNPDSLKDDMHFLKGSALNLGFAEMGVFCQKSEQAATTGDLDSINIAELVKIYSASKEIFETAGAQAA